MSTKVALIGTVEALMVDSPPDEKISSFRDQIICTLLGIEGDKHAGEFRDSSGVREREIFFRPKTDVRAKVMNWRQWSAVSVEEMLLLAHKYGLPETPDVAKHLAQLVGANMLVSGIPLFTQLAPTSLLAFPECSWMVMSENLPCLGAGNQIEQFYPQARAAEFAKLAMGIRGLVGTIFEAGIVKVGQQFSVERREYKLVH